MVEGAWGREGVSERRLEVGRVSESAWLQYVGHSPNTSLHYTDKHIHSYCPSSSSSSSYLPIKWITTRIYIYLSIFIHLFVYLSMFRGGRYCFQLEQLSVQSFLSAATGYAFLLRSRRRRVVTRHLFLCGVQSFSGACLACPLHSVGALRL